VEGRRFSAETLIASGAAATVAEIPALEAALATLEAGRR
jgi:hypothetical protein